jgi:hypothetical protein
MSLIKTVIKFLKYAIKLILFVYKYNDYKTMEQIKMINADLKSALRKL